MKNEQYKTKIPSTFVDRIFVLVQVTGLGLARPTRRGLAALDSPPDCQFTPASPSSPVSLDKTKNHGTL
ncbi:MAG: hypothetical protein E7615_00800 [Ruminococcaceae bacterium]|nr:hypothetical protein [Oscillospiraceae bacterium]